MTIRSFLIAIFVFLTTLDSFSQRFDFIISNRYEVMVDVAVTHKRGNSTKIEMVNDISPRGGRKIYTAKLKDGDYVQFDAISQDGSTYKSVKRTHKDMVMNTNNLPEGASPANVNLIRISSEPTHDIINFGELLVDITNNKYLQKLMDTSRVRINDKIGLGSFLIFKGDSLLESYPATDRWRNSGLNKSYNKYTGFQIKRVVKNDSVGGNINAPFIGKLAGQYGNNRMVDYRWRVVNYRETVWFANDKGPQAIFKSFPEDTGYNYLKSLIQTDTDVENYKIFFVSSVSLTDSIKLSADNFSTIDKNLDMNFGLPPSNIDKVVKLETGVEFYKSTRFYSEEDKSDIYNYFEVSPITQSALLNIYDELREQQLITKQEQISQQVLGFQSKINSSKSDLINTYRSFNTLIPDQVINTTEFNAIIAYNVPKLDIIEIPDTVNVSRIQELVNLNSRINSFNSLRDVFLEKRNEFLNLQNNYQQFITASPVEGELEDDPLRNIIFSSTVRRLNSSELEGVRKYSERNNE